MVRDELFMREALRLAALARGRTRPNPMVGAVVVKDGEIRGQGFHARAGTDHAEVVALREAGAAARGAELFVNLEPCNHHGRTGPCAQAVIAAGVQRVVIGMTDPNPLVDGRGAAALRAAGIEVTEGVLEDRCRRLNEAFACFITRQRPFVTLKVAISLDGRVATRTGDSRWVTGALARVESHRLRDTYDAIMVGVGTVLADDPALTCRDVPGGRDPIRVVLDSHLRMPALRQVLSVARTSSAPTWVAFVQTASTAGRAAELGACAGVELVPVESSTDGRIDPTALLAELGRRDITSVLLEGGPTVAGAFFDAGLVDRVMAFIAPKLLGDPQALPMIGGAPLVRMADACQLANVELGRFGEDVLITGTPIFTASLVGRDAPRGD